MSADTSARCSACDDQDCMATFVCSSCHLTRQVCSCQPGGFTSSASDLCVTCYEDQRINPEILHIMRRREYEQKNRAHRRRNP